MSSGMDTLKQKFQALSPRERNVLLVALLALIFFLWDTLLFAPLQADSRNAEQQINAATSKMQEQDAEIARLTAGNYQDPNADLRTKQAELQEQLRDADAEIKQVTVNLMSPRQMAEVLESLLRQRSKLKLVKVTNLASEQISSGIENKEGGSKTALYRHGVELLLEGEYFETMRYLQALEGLPWRMIWSSLEYEVIEYPRASVRLQLNTFSTQAAWIGV